MFAAEKMLYKGCDVKADILSFLTSKALFLSLKQVCLRIEATHVEQIWSKVCHCLFLNNIKSNYYLIKQGFKENRTCCRIHTDNVNPMMLRGLW